MFFNVTEIFNVLFCTVINFSLTKLHSCQFHLVLTAFVFLKRGFPMNKTVHIILQAPSYIEKNVRQTVWVEKRLQIISRIFSQNLH